MLYKMKAAGKTLPALACAALLTTVTPCAAQQPSVPYVPTPQSVVDRMLTMAKVTARDYLIDLGSGDGRIVVTALNNFATPLIRYEIGDYAEVGEICSCGRGFRPPTGRRRGRSGWTPP